MTALFELYMDGDDCFRFRLVAADGEVMLTSVAYAYEDVAIAGIWAVREAAVTGSIVDLTGMKPTIQDSEPPGPADTPPMFPCSVSSLR